jgi:hypothetical protein
MFFADLADEFWLDLALPAVSVTHRKPISFHFFHYFTIESDECFSPFSLSEPLVERRAFERRAKRKIQKMNAGASAIQGKKLSEERIANLEKMSECPAQSFSNI